MKNPLLDRLQLAPRLSKKDLWLTLIPFIAWGVLVQLRPVVLHTHCDSASTTPCTQESVLPIDQPGLGLESGSADLYSYYTQNLSGILTAIVPAAWNGALAMSGRLTPAAAIASTGTDFVLFLQTWGWNGMLTESTRLVIQRPRPYVYADPVRAKDPQNYVSFYSGHTSFAATACVCLLLILISRGVPTPLFLLMASIAQCLVLSTAMYRILAGRHFLSDVLAGAVMGGLVAVAVAWFHRPKTPLPR